MSAARLSCWPPSRPRPDESGRLFLCRSGIRREHFNRKTEHFLLGRLKRADSDDAARQLLASLIPDREHHRVLGRTAGCRVANGALDTQRRRSAQRPLLRFGTEAQVMITRGTDYRALEDRGLTVRTGARLPRKQGAHIAHEPVPSPFARVKVRAELPSVHPNSTWPRMRDPAATVSEPALTSPDSTPVSSSSTREAPSILPWSSPPTVTVWALTWPVRCAPASITRLPWTWTSPLNRPAIRTCPLPSILPSIVRSAAITDSLGSALARGCSRPRRVSELNGTAAGFSGSRTVVSRGEPVVAPPVVEDCSFQSAINESSPAQKCKRGWMVNR